MNNLIEKLAFIHLKNIGDEGLFPNHTDNDIFVAGFKKGYEIALDITKVTRVEVITEAGREYVNWKKNNSVEIQFQDDNKTLKIFISKTIPI